MNAELQPSRKPLTLENPLTYEQFGAQPEYMKVNRALIDDAISLLPKELMSVNAVDVATGTGLVPKLLIESLERTGRKGHIIGVDPNQTSLEIARRTIQPSNNVSVEFIPGFGQMLRTILNGKGPEDGFDIVSILDAIHEIPGEDTKQSILKTMADILKPGGLFLYNSAFTTAAMEGSAMEWGKWKMAAFNLLNGTRDKNVVPIKIHKPEEYRGMLENAGLEIKKEGEQPVNLTRSALEAISKYPEFIEGVFRDMKETASVELKEKSQALISALDRLNIVSIKRTWHEIIAQKPLQGPQFIGANV